MTPGLSGMVEELTRPHIHRERIKQPRENRDGSLTWVEEDHITRHESLLDQLGSADQSKGADQAFGTAMTSKPPVRLDALDALALIDEEASRSVRLAGENDPGSTAACVTACYRIHAETADEEYAAALAHQIRRWWSIARVASDWDSKPWRPDNTCPLCGQNRALRVRVEERAAYCANCRETWDAGTIGILADHIRLENADAPREDADVAFVSVRDDVVP